MDFWVTSGGEPDEEVDVGDWVRSERTLDDMWRFGGTRTGSFDVKRWADYGVWTIDRPLEVA